ncbi:unnamed protein product [Scytosiphon promiscuus]
MATLRALLLRRPPPPSPPWGHWGAAVSGALSAGTSTHDSSNGTQQICHTVGEGSGSGSNSLQGTGRHHATGLCRHDNCNLSSAPGLDSLCSTHAGRVAALLLSRTTAPAPAPAAQPRSPPPNSAAGPAAGVGELGPAGIFGPHTQPGLASTAVSRSEQTPVTRYVEFEGPSAAPSNRRQCQREGCEIFTAGTPRPFCRRHSVTPLGAEAPLVTDAAAAAVDAAAAAAATAAAVGGSLSTAAPVGRSRGNSTPGTFSSTVATELFKCMYDKGEHRSVCGEGRDYRHLQQKGPWHSAGTVRVSFFNQNREAYDAFCPTHADKVGEHHAKALREWNARNPQQESAPSRKEGKSKGKGKGKGKRNREGGLGWAAAGGGASASAAAAGDAAGGGASASAAAAGGGRQSSRRRLAHADEAFKVSQRALLNMSFPNQSASSNNDADLSRPLDMRQQRHEEMGKAALDAMVTKLVTQSVKGMPVPQQDGSLKIEPGGTWTGVDKGMLPRINLGCPMNRANGLVKRALAEEDVLSDAVKQDILHGFQFIGTIVVFAPEVTCRDVLSRDSKFAASFVDEDMETKDGVRMLCPDCLSNNFIKPERSWHTKIRPIHTTEGRNQLLLSRRYRCFNPGCSRVQEAVKKKMKTKAGDETIYVRDVAGKREINSQDGSACGMGGWRRSPQTRSKRFSRKGSPFPSTTKHTCRSCRQPRGCGIRSTCSRREERRMPFLTRP